MPQIGQTPPTANTQKTVLVVNDDEGFLTFISELLVCGDYNVLTAGTGETALQQSKDYEGEIHLLVSDFPMLGMNGIALATQMDLDRPRLKVLLMSGFIDGMLVLNDGWHFLPKPFIPSQLRMLVTGLISPH